ncbi:MAG TPA: hypothetical protein VIJ42_10310 [Stellaceae bacterium]
MTRADTVTARPIRLLVLAIVATLVALVSFVVNLAIMMMSPMMFDAGESAWLWTVFIAIWLTPLVLAAGIAVAWLGFGIRWTGVAIAGLAIVLAPAAMWLVLVLFG